MNILLDKTPDKLAQIMAQNLRKLRKARGISRKNLADKSKVSYGSIRRFEELGEISLKSLLKIAIVLDCTDEFEDAFTQKQINSIQEIIDGKV